MHRLRVSTTTQLEVIDKSLNIDYALRSHLGVCTNCSDQAFCDEAQVIVNERERNSRTLALIGLNDEVG